MGPNSGIYKALTVAHILCAIVGFGAVFLNGLYAAQMKKVRGAGSAAIFDANHRVSMVGEYFIYAVFVFGVLLVVTSDDAVQFSDKWIGTSLTLYIVGIAVSHGILMPTVKKIGGLLHELADAGPPPAGATGPPPQAVQLEALGKRAGACGAFLNVLLVVIIALMVWKPV